MTPREKAELDLKLTEEAPPAQDSAELERMRFPEQLIVLAKRKWFIFKFVGCAAVLSAGISLLLPKMYTASAKIMPPQQNQSMASMAALSQLGQLGPLAALGGQGLGLRNPSDLYVAMLGSRTVADALIDRFSLMSIYRKRLRVDARRRLEDRTLIVAGKDGVISISVEDRDPQRAADLANGYVDELEKLTRMLAMTEAGKRRIFFEREVKMASDDLANAELELKQTQEKTGIIQLNSQSAAMIGSMISLRGQVAAQEVQVQAIRSFAAAENPVLVRAEQELSAMRDQLKRAEGGQGKRSFGDVPIENVPTAGLEYVRKYRDVKYHEALYELLAKQYEAAKVDEARDTFIVQQLDRALRPEKRSWPKPYLIIPFATVLALFVAILVAFFMEVIGQAKNDPRFVARLQLFKFHLRGGYKW